MLSTVLYRKPFKSQTPTTRGRQEKKEALRGSEPGRDDLGPGTEPVLVEGHRDDLVGSSVIAFSDFFPVGQDGAVPHKEALLVRSILTFEGSPLNVRFAPLDLVHDHRAEVVSNPLDVMAFVLHVPHFGLKDVGHPLHVTEFAFHLFLLSDALDKANQGRSESTDKQVEEEVKEIHGESPITVASELYARMVA